MEIAQVKGKPDMVPGLAAIPQADQISALFANIGAFESLAFEGWSPGFDVYDATFANGRLIFFIAPLGPGGKIQRLTILMPSYWRCCKGGPWDPGAR